MSRAINNRQKKFTKRDYTADIKKVRRKAVMPRPVPKPPRVVLKD